MAEVRIPVGRGTHALAFDPDDVESIATTADVLGDPPERSLGQRHLNITFKPESKGAHWKEISNG